MKKEERDAILNDIYNNINFKYELYNSEFERNHVDLFKKKILLNQYFINKACKNLFLNRNNINLLQSTLNVTTEN